MNEFLQTLDYNPFESLLPIMSDLGPCRKIDTTGIQSDKTLKKKNKEVTTKQETTPKPAQNSLPPQTVVRKSVEQAITADTPQISPETLDDSKLPIAADYGDSEPSEAGGTNLLVCYVDFSL
jgi:hypothetical protein